MSGIQNQTLTWEQINQVLMSWREQAMQEEKTAQLWNCIFDDLAQLLKAE